MRHPLIGVALACALAGCRRSNDVEAKKDSPPIVRASAAPSASTKNVPLFERACFDGKLATGSSGTGMPYAGPQPTDDTGPFTVIGEIENARPEFGPVAKSDFLSIPENIEFTANESLCATIKDVRACIEAARKTSPSLVGTINAEVAVKTSGAVSSVRLLGGTLNDATVEACAKTALEKASFSPPDNPWTFEYRIVARASHGRSAVATIVEKKSDITPAIGDVGLLFDRHGVKLNELSDELSPVRSFGGFAGLKWVFQSKADVAVQGYGTAHKHYRMAYYVHVIRAFTQGFDQPAGLAGTDKEVKGAPLGGRFGMEGKFPGELGFFIKYEAGAMPSARGADWNMFVFLGASLARPLF